MTSGNSIVANAKTPPVESGKRPDAGLPPGFGHKKSLNICAIVGFSPKK
jgi:hypothetical protein